MKLERVATLVSLVLSPQLYGGLVSYLAWRTLGLGGLEALYVLLTTQTILPLAPIVADTARGKVDIFVTDRSVRLKYYLLTLASYALGAFYCLLRGWVGYLLFYAAYACTVVLLTFINEAAKWKVSAHAAGITGPTTALVCVGGLEYAGLYLLAAPVFWARLKLRAHTPGQLVAGAVVAAAVTALVFYAGWRP